MEVHTAEGKKCPVCGAGPPVVYNFRNSDDFLKKETGKIPTERKEQLLLN